MGRPAHLIIAVTSCDQFVIEICHNKATEMFGQLVSLIQTSKTNSFTFFVGPSGACSTGSPLAEMHEENCNHFVQWIQEHKTRKSLPVDFGLFSYQCLPGQPFYQ